ncbi:RING-H2 finger protein ATL74-like [Lotus japonicus]|uniref:RING-H2 finger protein ATL74-like n=1 Tax=Lotus japonicus TaxID=34305 RepID=UPI00258C28AE|nr:RING-H2 finger protein ATL74-like [Lotus japonicus]
MALHHGLHRRLLLHHPNSTGPGSRNWSRESLTGSSDFDTIMVFILAGLVFAFGLIFSLVLRSIVRCAQRCSRSFAFETPDEAVPRLGSKELKKSAFHQIPKVVYGSGSTSSAATDCSICLGEFMDGVKVRVLPKCNHVFHVKCIDVWLLSHSSCPNCREVIA